MKKRFLMCAVLVLCLGFVVNGTLAYFTGEEIVHNVITTGNIDIDLVEMAKNDNDELVPFKDVDGVMPGCAVSKIVYVTNTGDNEAWVRIGLDLTIDLKHQGQADPSMIGLDLNLGTEPNQWTEKDGYYYYNSKLAPNESTEPLFTEVTFSTEMGNIYKSSKIELDVFAHATQVANNPIPEGGTVADVQGWPTT